MITTDDNVIHVETSTGSYMVEMSDTPDTPQLEPPAPLFIAPINTHSSVKVHVSFQGWKLQIISAFPSEKCPKNLPVYYFGLSWTGRQTVISTISAFPSEMCLNSLLVRLYFYLSRTGGQRVISIPGFWLGNNKKSTIWLRMRCLRQLKPPVILFIAPINTQG